MTRINLKRFLFGITLILTITVVSGQSISPQNPSEGYNYNFDSDLTVEWDSVNDGGSTSTLNSSTISIIDSEGNSVSKDFSRNQDVSSGSSVSESTSFGSNSLEDNLNDNSEWTVRYVDEWSNLDQSRLIDVDITAGLTGSTKTNINDPADEGTLSFSDDITIKWETENAYSQSQDLTETEVTIQDESGNSYTDVVSGSTFNSGETKNSELTVSSGDLSDLDDSETWTVEVKDKWDSVESSSDTISILNSGSGGGSDGSYSIEVLQTNASEPYDYSSDLDIEWESQHTFDTSRELDYSEITIEDEDGFTVNDQVEQNVDVGSSEVIGNSISFTKTELDENLGPGIWTIEVVDKWAQSDQTKTIELDAESNTNNNDSTDDNTSDDGSDVIIDDGNDGDDSTDSDNTTDDSTDDSTDCPDGFSYDSENDVCVEDDNSDSDSDDSTNDCPDGFTYDSENDVCVEDDNSDSDSDDSTNDCPDGFTYDSENEVCVEDDSTNDGDSSNGDDSDGSSDDESSTDDQSTGDDELTGGDDANTSMLQQEVAGGVTIQTIVIGLLAVLTLGLLFKRSSYTVKF
jgi:hypothetical protein